ncbi:MAG: DUF421 domain-containing protein [Christensenellales bacterium]|jgi:uncharacterized membrane protein YcaP (DUF421 family)
MATIFFRTILVYIVVLVIMRLLGKSQLGQLQPFELVVALIIADLASGPISGTDTPLIYGLIPIITLFLLQRLFSLLSIKSQRLNFIMNGKPSILVENGRICFEEFKSLNYTIGDLLEQLRQKDVQNIDDVVCAILEVNGTLSVLLRKKCMPPTAEDLNLELPESGIFLPIISDGFVNKKALAFLRKDDVWLQSQLKKEDCSHPDEVLLFMVNDSGDSYFQKKSSSGQAKRQGGML